jgi:nitrate/nitrite transport system ATP-binding protein
MNAGLEIHGLTKTFDGPTGPVAVVRSFDLSLHRGEFVSLIGHSGCGKSTVLSIAAGLLEATAGDVTVAGRRVSGPGLDRGVVFQSPCLLPWLTALENVRLGVDRAYEKKRRREREEIARRWIAAVGLDEARHKRASELSAGMRQRVGIARAFALSPKVLLLDEPFGMLDSLTRQELQDLLLEVWSSDRKSALLVTHDVDEALLLSDRVAMMTTGPEARLGGIVDVPFARPRDREAVRAHPAYDDLRERVISFLEGQGHLQAPPPESDTLERKTTCVA